MYEGFLAHAEILTQRREAGRHKDVNRLALENDTP